MKKILLVLLAFLSLSANAQLTLSPNGFNSISVDKPLKTNEEFIELSRSWAASYNRSIEYPFEIYNVTENSFEIDAQRPNAFFYTNRGEAYYHRIKYIMKVTLNDKKYTVNFNVKEIYTSNVLTEMTLAELFTEDNRLKDEYSAVKPSLEKTVNGIVNSYTKYMASY